jgi:hypothetical protein
MSNVSQNVLKFYQQLTGEERRITFIFEAVDKISKHSEKHYSSYHTT